MASLSATYANVANKGDYAGEHCLYTSYSSNTTVSAGDVVYAGRLPSGVMVTEVVLIPGAAAGGSGVFKVGTTSNDDAFFLSATASATLAVKASVAGAIGYVCSVSDAATVRYEYITVTPASGVTAGRWFDLIVKYVNRNDNA